MITDGNAMGVAAQIAEHRLWLIRSRSSSNQVRRFASAGCDLLSACCQCTHPESMPQLQTPALDGPRRTLPMQIASRRFDVLVAHQNLNGSQVRSVFEHVHSEAVPAIPRAA
jgi:hypothetical protein